MSADHWHYHRDLPPSTRIILGVTAFTAFLGLAGKAAYDYSMKAQEKPEVVHSSEEIAAGSTVSFRSEHTIYVNSFAITPGSILQVVSVRPALFGIGETQVEVESTTHNTGTFTLSLSEVQSTSGPQNSQDSVETISP